MDTQVTSAEVRRLLLGYDTALDAADSLPALVRIAGKRRRWTLFDPLRRLPRATFGTSSMVIHHVQRSTAALGRRYARIAAVRGLTEDEERARGLVLEFRGSLPEVRWRAIIPAAAVAVFLAINVVVGGVTRVVADALASAHLTGRPSGATEHRLAESVFRSVSAAPSADSLIDLLDQFTHAGPAELLALAATTLTAFWIVARPLSSAFRVKRLLFNLATNGPVDIDSTTTAANVARSAGLYRLERELFRRLGTRAPNEIDVDLWLGVIPTVGLTWLLLAGDLFLISDNVAGFIGLVGITAGLVAARVAWLLRTARARNLTTAADPPPDRSPGLDTGGGFEARSPLETAAFGAASFMLLFVAWFPPLLWPAPPWIRLVLERRDLEPRRMQARGQGRVPGRRVWPGLGSALLLWLIPAVPVAIHLTHLARMQPPGVGSAARTRTWLVALAAVATPLLLSDGIYLREHYRHTWYGASILPLAGIFATIFAAVQHEHNALAQDTAPPGPLCQADGERSA